MSLQAVMAEVNRRLRAGLAEAAAFAAEKYREEASALTYPPRSDDGDYPAVETGQGLANISHGLDPDPTSLEARMGVMGTDTYVPERGRENRNRRGGMHMHWVKTRYGRRDMENIMVDYHDAIAEAFKRGASSP
jgi:hypothetical protein